MKPKRLTKRWLLLSAGLLTIVLGWVAIDHAPGLYNLWRLEHGSVEERIEVVRCIEETIPIRARRILTDVARDDEAPEVRVEATWALIRLLGAELDDDAYDSVARSMRMLARQLPYVPRLSNFLT